MYDLNFVEYRVTCHTSECENCDLTIQIEAPAENPYFMCGACMQQITDFTTN